MKCILLLFISGLLLAGCATTKHYNPAQKIAPQALQQDYGVFKKILEAHHPGLYWYTPKDSMDAAFAAGYAQLQDSLNETQFRNVLSKVLAMVRCGHTTVFPSKRASAVRDSLRPRLFPLQLKIWRDTAVVYGNLNPKDSVIKKGSMLLSIDGRPVQQIVDTLFYFISADGYNTTHKYQTLSNGLGFGRMFTAVYGSKDSFAITYLDSAQNTASATVHLLPRDSTKRIVTRMRRLRKKARQAFNRSLQIDSARNLAVMNLNTFTKEARLRHFFNRSFKTLEKQQIENLIIDLRSNGGGSVTNSNLLTRYIIDRPFKVADSLFALSRKSSYGRYIQHYFWNRLFMQLFTRRQSDGLYHFVYYEKKIFHPKRRHHFDGKVFILTGGNTFSASTLFIQKLAHQQNVKVVGEETGGGAYGNNAWQIPDVTLPHSHVRFRLPLYRLVIDSTAQKGRGIMPDMEALPTVEALRSNKDFKKEKVLEALKQK